MKKVDVVYLSVERDEDNPQKWQISEFRQNKGKITSEGADFYGLTKKKAILQAKKMAANWMWEGEASRVQVRLGNEPAPFLVLAHKPRNKPYPFEILVEDVSV